MRKTRLFHAEVTLEVRAPTPANEVTLAQIEGPLVPTPPILGAGQHKEAPFHAVSDVVDKKGI